MKKRMMRAVEGMEKLLKNYLVQQLPLNTGLIVEEGTPLKAVLFLMRDQKTGSALVMRENKPIGIFTEHDFRKVVLNGHSWDEPIEVYASKDPWTVQPDMPLKKAITLMKEKRIRHVPVMDASGKAVGVLSIRNIIKLIAEHFPADVMNLPPRLHKNPTTPEGG